MQDTHYISSELLDLETIKSIVDANKSLALSEEATLNIKKSYAYLHKTIEKSSAPVYGINTGFGSLCDVEISNENLSQLQENLVMSHACGTGDYVPKPIVKLMLLLKIQSLSYGHSGVQLETVERLIDFYNEDILPVIYSQGSLGASGDLAPLAHLALPLLGKGNVYIEDKNCCFKSCFKKIRLETYCLTSKRRIGITKRNSIYECLWRLLSFKRLQIFVFSRFNKCNLN